MRRLTLLALAGVIAGVGRPVAQSGDVVGEAAAALGADRLQSVRFTAVGAQFSVGQSPRPRERWPRVKVARYEARIDYAAAVLRVELVREQGPIQPRGGGRPFTGQQRLIQLVSPSAAWDEPAPAPPQGRRGGPPASDAPEDARPPPQPQPGELALRTLQLWLTPHGFLRAAGERPTSITAVSNGDEVSFDLDIAGTSYRLTGLIDEQHHVAWVRTRIPNPVLGDMLVETEPRDYLPAGDGILFPRYVVQRQGGHPSLELWVDEVEPNAAVDIATPPAVAGAALPAVTVEAESIGPGIQYLRGGSHHSVAIEMADHVVLVEAPLDEARSLAVIDRVDALFPGKPIRYVVNTHHHFDHAGGLRTFVARGATIVTHEGNRAFYETAWRAPRTLAPDELSASGRTPVFETFDDRHVLSDGARTVEVHHLTGNPHDAGMAVVYLPAERLLIEADVFAPADTPPTDAPPAARGRGRGGPPFLPPAINLFESVQRLGLNVDRIAALHGARLSSMAELAAATGRD